MPVERDLADVHALGDAGDVASDKAIFNRWAGRRLHEAVAHPGVIWRPVPLGPIDQRGLRGPEGRKDVPDPALLSDQDEGREVGC
ncbi:hypothetical protein D3C71_1695960 [compost metagenome]